MQRQGKAFLADGAAGKGSGQRPIQRAANSWAFGRRVRMGMGVRVVTVVTNGQTIKSFACHVQVFRRGGRERGAQDNSRSMAWITRGIGSH